MIDINNRKFTALQNSENGEVSSSTVFHYFQKGSVVWAEYSGGDILTGHLLGTREGNELDFRYHHINTGYEKKAGTCRSVITKRDTKVLLTETWAWFGEDNAHGTSEVIEL